MESKGQKKRIKRAQATRNRGAAEETTRDVESKRSLSRETGHAFESLWLDKP
jgi:hypothetical protein